MRRADLGCWFGLLLFGMVSCTGPVIKEGRGYRAEVRRIDLTRVRFHRPPLIPVSPTELEESDRKDEVRSCIRPDALWKDLLTRHEAIGKCLNSLKAGKVKYRLVKQASLELVFEPESGSAEAPSCLATVLPKIPLPREIYFFAETEPSGELEALSLSFDPKNRAWIDWDFLSPRTRFLFPVPPSRELLSARDLEAGLLIWVFSLFYPEQGPIRAAFVPEFDANACFDGKRNAGVPGVFWP